MPVPAKPTVPVTPTRAEPSTFSERAERMVDFFFALLGYIAEANDFTDEQAQLALTAGMASSLADLDLSSLAGKVLGVNQGGTGIIGSPHPTSRPIASTAQARAGTNNANVLTPLRTAEVIERLRVTIDSTTYNIVST